MISFDEYTRLKDIERKYEELKGTHKTAAQGKNKQKKYTPS